MVKIESTSSYSIKGEIAYQINYSDSSKVRAVVSRSGFIRKEFVVNGEWKLVGKPYLVKNDRGRQAERIVQIVKGNREIER